MGESKLEKSYKLRHFVKYGLGITTGVLLFAITLFFNNSFQSNFIVLSSLIVNAYAIFSIGRLINTCMRFLLSMFTFLSISLTTG